MLMIDNEISADLNQIAERLKNPAKAISLQTTALAGGFFLYYSKSNQVFELYCTPDIMSKY